MCWAYWRTISRCPINWLGALYCSLLTLKIAYLLTRAGSSSYSAVRRTGNALITFVALKADRALLAKREDEL